MKNSKGRSNDGENEDYTDNAIEISHFLESSSEFRILSNTRRTTTTADRQFALYFRNKSVKNIMSLQQTDTATAALARIFRFSTYCILVK